MSKTTLKIAAGAGLLAASFFFPALAPWALAAMRVGGSLLLASGSKPKIKAPVTMGSEVSLSGDPIGVREVIYGFKYTGGTLRFRQAAGANNKDLYMVIVVAGHEVDSIPTIIADKKVLTLDGSGNVTAVDGSTTDAWVGLMNVRTYTGTDSQTADATLTSVFSGTWTSNHRLRGLAYAIVKLTFDESKLNQIPEFRFLVKGKKVYDPRLDSTNGGSGSHRLATPSTWAWSENAALCLCDFARGVKVNGVNVAGGWAADTRFDWANVIAEANVCDENVSLAAGGTQKRYTADILLDPRQPPNDLKRHFELAMAGDFIVSDAKWRFFAGAYRTPTLSLDDSLFIGPLQHEVWQDEGSRIDTATGTFASLTQFGSEIAYTPIALSGADASSPRMLSLDLQAVADTTNSGGTFDGGARCQRIAKLELEKQAAGKKITVTTSLYGLRCMPGETVQITHAAFGLTAQTMRVLEVLLRVETVEVSQGKHVLVPMVDLSLEAGPSSLYTWSATEVAIAAPPALPRLVVPPPAYGWNWTPQLVGVTRDAAGNFTKTGGAPTTWDSSVYSLEGYTRCSVTFKAGQTNKAFMIALDTNATTNNSYTSLEFAIYCRNDGVIHIYESSTDQGAFGVAYSTTDQFAIVYDGTMVRYYQNQTLLRSVAVSSPNSKLYLDSSFFDTGAAVKELQFGPIMNAGTNSIDPNAATDVSVASTSSFTITHQQHSPDGQSFNDQILSLTYVPPVSCDVLVQINSYVSYAMASAHAFADFQYSIQQDSAYVDEQHQFMPAPGATDIFGFNVTYAKKFSVTAGVSTTFKFFGAQFNSDDVVTVQNAQLQLVAIKR